MQSNHPNTSECKQSLDYIGLSFGYRHRAARRLRAVGSWDRLLYLHAPVASDAEGPFGGLPILVLLGVGQPHERRMRAFRRSTHDARFRVGRVWVGILLLRVLGVPALLAPGDSHEVRAAY